MNEPSAKEPSVRVIYDDNTVTFDLMLSLYGIGFMLPSIADWRRTLRGDRQP